MSDKFTVTGQAALVDNTNNNNVLTADLADVFGQVDNVLEHNKVVRKIKDTDGVVALDKGGVGTIRGMYLFIKEGSGTVTLKHDSNTNGMTVEGGIMLTGSLDAITIETTSTQELSVEYLLFE